MSYVRHISNTRCLLNIRQNFNLFTNARLSIGTWSPLATAFNTKPGQILGLKFNKNHTGLFNIDALKTYDGFFLLKDDVILATDTLVKEACSTSRKRKMVDIFDELSDTLCSVADLAEFVRLAHPSSEFAYSAENACISLSGLVEKLNTNQEIYKALKQVVEKGDIVETSSIDDHVASLFLFDFEQSGIHLPENKRQEVVGLNNYILHLGQKFMNASVDSRKVSTELIPQNLRYLFNKEDGKFVVGALYADVENELARELAYKIYLKPEEEQERTLTEMLISRHKLANLCGFPTYAHRALNSSLAENPKNVWDLLVSLNEQLKTRVDSDFEAMLEMKRVEIPSANSLAPWDIPYFSSKAKRELKSEHIDFSAYFSLGTCMDGLNNIMQKLYGISLKNESILPGEVWSQDVYKLAVVHETEGLLGYIYCDFYERRNKPNQDCHFTIRGGKRKADGTYQNPIVVVMLNIPTPKWDGPSLLTPALVDNLFHEMGHAMHSMLARTEHQHVTGTRCTMDFAEVPSVLMEYFASDPRVLRTFAKHYRTQQPMPEEMLKQLCTSKRLFSAFDTQLQVFYAALDQVYHGQHPLNGTTTEVLQDVQKKFYRIPYVPDSAWQLRFSHLVGYGAKYYSYLMSRAVASSIWNNYFIQDPFNRDSGENYRHNCLAHGGGKPPRQLITDFLHYDPTPSTLASAVIADLDKKWL